jgi:hypothetical protein
MTNPIRLSPEGAAAALEVQLVFAHMAETSAVMFDRSMWFAPVYETLARDGFRFLCQSRADLAGREDSVAEPVRYALGYAQVVFLGTAVELTLLIIM